jgi:multidrug resistance efflux pump
MNKRDEYIEKMKTQLDQWNAEISQWEAKAHSAQAEARAGYDKQLEALRQQREQAAYQMKLVQNAAGDAWLDLTRGADEAWARMRAAFETATEHFRSR